MKQVYAPIFALAQTHHLPIIDLTRSFDPAADRLFRSQIEPSGAGSSRIVHLLTHALRRHQFPDAAAGGGERGGSRIYSMPPGSATVVEEKNEGVDKWLP